MTIGEAREILLNPHLHPNSEVVIFTSRWAEAILYELEHQGNWWHGQLAKWALRPLRKRVMRVLITGARLHVYEAGPTPQLRFTNEKIPVFVIEENRPELDSKQLQLFAGQGIVRR